MQLMIPSKTAPNRRPLFPLEMLLHNSREHVKTCARFPGLRDPNMLRFQGRKYRLVVSEAGMLTIYGMSGAKIIEISLENPNDHHYLVFDSRGNVYL